MVRCDRIGWLCSRGDVNFALDDNCTVMKDHTDWVVVVYNTDPQNPLCTGSISHNTSFSTETFTFLSPIGILWNTGLVHRGICEMGLFTRDYLKSTYWAWSHHYLPKHLIQDYIRVILHQAGKFKFAKRHKNMSLYFICVIVIPITNIEISLICSGCARYPIQYVLQPIKVYHVWK